MIETIQRIVKTTGMLLTAYALTTSAAVAAPMFSDIYIFGDSLSDTGNTRAAVPLGTNGTVATLAGYGPNGRFSNGPVWHEYLADQLGLARATRSSGGGTNYAYGGARVDNAGGVSAGVLAQEITFNANQAGAPSDPDALYIAWAGGNDMRDLVGSADPFAAIEATLDRLVGVLGRLIDSGASTLLVPNLPDLGSIPEFRSTSNSGSATLVTNAWNSGLDMRLNGLARTTSASIFHLDVFGVFNDILANPAPFGFTNTADECRSVASSFFGLVQTERTCSGAAGYVFWDEIHPTTSAHAQLGAGAFALLSSGAPLGQVPTPLTVWLLLIGLVVLTYTRRVRMPSCD
jgi:phospholipase/lecithinase/hemolysin